MEIRGYGEDAHTLLLLQDSQALGLVLGSLRIRTTMEESLAFYRPSFGRGSGGGATFGEFDAVLLVPRHILLIESKWIPEPGKRVDTIRIAAAQALRHGIFRAYLEARFRHRSLSFEDLLGKVERVLADGPVRRGVPKSKGRKTRLYQNLEDTLEMIKKFYSGKPRPRIWNLVTVFRSDGRGPCARRIRTPGAVRIELPERADLRNALGEFHRVDIDLGLEDPRHLILHPR